MTELMKQNSLRTHTRDPLGTGVENMQRTPRCRFGQTRAPKRCIIEYKRGPHRTRRNQRSDGASKQSDRVVQVVRNENVAPSSHHNVGDIPVPHSNSPRMDSTPPSSPNSGIFPPNGRSSSVLTDNKRSRPEMGLTNSNESLSDLSSSAPASCMRATPPPVLLFDQNRPNGSTRDRLPQFVCQVPLIDEKLLHFLLSKEPLYHPNNAFLYYVNPEVEDKVDAALRNEAVHNLRFMHSTFFNLSTETFCKAVNLIDRFIVKVKVKPKYMACVATASYCAASKLCDSNKKDVDLPAPDTLVQITRCGGNAADLLRMEEILDSKLAHDLDGVNAYDFLRVFIDCLTETTTNTTTTTTQLTIDEHGTEVDVAASGDNGSLTTAITEVNGVTDSTHPVQRNQFIRRLMTRLEIALCSLEVYRFRPACLALAILAQAGVKDLGQLADLCRLDWSDVVHCATLVDNLYDLSPSSRRPLVWHLSRRTLLRIGYSSPTPLDTITEDCEYAHVEHHATVRLLAQVDEAQQLAGSTPQGSEMVHC